MLFQEEEKRLNIDDIARLAGVSRTTVSRILNNLGPVNEDTYKRVMAVIKEHNYSPNPTARNLMRKKTDTIGVVIASMVRTHWTNILGGIDERLYESAPEQNAIVMSLGSVESTELRDYLLKKRLEKLIQNRVDGMIIAVQEKIRSEDYELLKKSGIPYVVIQDVESEMAPLRVAIKNYEVSYMVIKRFLDKGHKKIAYVCSPSVFVYANERKMGYLNAMVDHGLEIDQSFVLQGDNSFSCGTEYMRKMMSMEERPTAVAFCTDRMAFGAIRYLTDNHYCIPKDVSIAGFDAVGESAEVFSLFPPLDTVLQPSKQLGAKAVDLLLEAIEKKSKNKPKTIYLPTELIDRGTCKDLNGK